MFVEILIYIYLGICAGMILFNIVTALLSRRRAHRFHRRSTRFEKEISRELDRLAETGEVSAEHLRRMERKLRRVNNMVTYDQALERLLPCRPALVRDYLLASSGVVVALAEDYCRRDEIESAYFPYLIKKYRLLSGESCPELKAMLLDLLHEPSLYCRENTMQAIYTSGDPVLVVQALQIINADSYYYSGKLLSDGLLNYTGSSQVLAYALWCVLAKFQPWLQVALLNYPPMHTVRRFFPFSMTPHRTMRFALPACAIWGTIPILPPAPVCWAMPGRQRICAGSMPPLRPLRWQAIRGGKLQRS